MESRSIFSGFSQIRTKKTRVGKEAIIIAPTYVAFSQALLRKTAEMYIGFYVNSAENKMLIHLSKVKQAGYFHCTKGRFMSKLVLDAFKTLKLGTNVIDVIERLNYIDEDVIEIRGKERGL